jgi:DNA-binding MarR family transcriptional regulator
MNPKDPDRSAAMPPGPTSQLLDNLGKIIYNLNAVIRPLAERHDLGPRGMWALRCIADGKVYPSDIAAAMMIGPTLVTKDLQRLMEAQLVTRQLDLGDRRRSCFKLTKKGRDLVMEGFSLYEKRVTPKLKSYDPKDLASFLRLLGELSEEKWLAADVTSSLEAAKIPKRLQKLEDENRKLKLELQKLRR